MPLTPHALAADPLGRLWMLDRARGRVMKLGEDGSGRSFPVSGGGQPAAPVATDLAASGTYLFLLDPPAASVTLLDLDGYFRETIDLGPELERAGRPDFLASRILVGGSGDLWLLEEGGGRLLHFDRRGRFVDAPLETTSGSARPGRISDAVVSPEDELLLLDASRARVIAIGSTGAIRAEPSLLDRPLRDPAALAVDEAGRRFVLEGNGTLHVRGPEGDSLFTASLAFEGGATPPRAVVSAEGWFGCTQPAKGLIRRWRIPPRDAEDVRR